MSDMISIWLSGGLALGVGVVAALVLLSRKARAEEAEDLASQLTDVDERVRSVVALLRDLKEQQPKLDADRYAQEKSTLEAKGVELLREREKVQAEAARAATPASPSFAQQHPQAAGMLWGGGLVLVVGILYLGATRPTQAPEAGAASGGMQAAGADASADPEFQQAMGEVIARLEQKPDDVDALLDAAHLALMARKKEDAAAFLDRAMQIAPEDPNVLLQLAQLLASQGKIDAALAHLDLLVKLHPEFADGWFIRGMVGMQLGNAEVRDGSFKRYLEVAPNGPRAEQARRILSAGMGANP